MTFETVIPEMFERFPEFHRAYEKEFEYMGHEAPLAYSVFGSILVPALKNALRIQDYSLVASICLFLEDVAQSSEKDPHLRDLLLVEIGEWLGWAANEDLLTRFLGQETKRICGYIPGLASQRLQIRAEKRATSLSNRITSFFRRFNR